MQRSADYCNPHKVCAGCSTEKQGKVVVAPIIIKKTAQNSSLLCESCRKKLEVPALLHTGKHSSDTVVNTLVRFSLLLLSWTRFITLFFFFFFFFL